MTPLASLEPVSRFEGRSHQMTLLALLKTDCWPESLKILLDLSQRILINDQIYTEIMRKIGPSVYLYMNIIYMSYGEKNSFLRMVSMIFTMCSIFL